MVFTLQFFIAITCGAAGGFLLMRLKFPAGLLVGAIVAASAFSVYSGGIQVPSFFSVLLQIISGTLIGSSFSRKDLTAVGKLLIPSSLFIIGMVLTNLLMGTLISLLSPLDLITALAGTIPGGMTTSFIMADQLGADVPTVAVMHMSRLLFSLMLFPSLITFLLRNDEAYREESSEAAGASGRRMPAGLQVLYTLSVGTLAGWAGSFIPFIPVPAMLVSMIAVSFFNVSIHPTSFPTPLRKAAQILAGVLVGSKVTMDTVLGLGQLIIPVALMLAGYLVFHTLIGYAVSRITGMNKGISLFCTIPAGASDIALIADDMAYSSPVIPLIQMTRLIASITVFPIIIKLFALFVG